MAPFQSCSLNELSHPFVFASFYCLTVGFFLTRFLCPFRRLLTGIPAIRTSVATVSVPLHLPPGVALSGVPCAGNSILLLLHFGIDHQAIEQYVLELVDYCGAACGS